MMYKNQAISKNISRWICLLLTLALADSLVAGASLQDKVSGIMTVSCPDRLELAEDDNSRSGILIRLDPGHPGCRVQGIVGGEHISYIGFYGRELPWYRVDFKRISGDPMHWLSWPEQAPIAWNDTTKVMVVGPLEERGIIISLSAHPYGEYEIQVQGFTEQPKPSGKTRL